jgi:transcriptional regulator with XRE-family HTH domain
MVNKQDKYEHPNKLAIAIGGRVRQAREEAGLSQADLAKMVYVQRNSITSIETGKSEPSVSTLLLIATSLEKPIEYFIADVPIPSAWKLTEDSLNVEERLLLLKFRDIREPRDTAIILALIDSLVRLELKEYDKLLADIRERDKGQHPELDALMKEAFDKIGDETWIEQLRKNVLGED